MGISGWTILLVASALFMTVTVRIVSWRDHWGLSGWAVVYLGSSLALGLIWNLALR
ncbi:MAG TPA: hypothetical protein VEC19_08810 [Usitatibacter sp.]|nr:hypothetical protein [Usitatibacter sp.]